MNWLFKEWLMSKLRKLLKIKRITYEVIEEIIRYGR